MNRRTVFLGMVVLFLLLPGPGPLDGQVTQEALAERVLSQNPTDRHAALREIMDMGPDNAGPALRAALITALEREVRQVDEHHRLAELGREPEDREDPEFVSRLTRVVAELRDPNTIPALVASLGTGATASIWALADHGEQAAPAVLAAASSPGSRPRKVDWALITLRAMAEDQDARRLSPQTLRRMSEVARDHLFAQQTGAGLTLRFAIDLAVVLGEPGLLEIVGRLAADSTELAARGLADSALIERIQRHADARLSGVPPVPRRP